MQNITFGDGTSLPAAAVWSRPGNYSGAYRDALELQFAPATISFDALHQLVDNTDATARLTVAVPGENYTAVYDNYVIRGDLALKPVEIPLATGAEPAVAEDRLCVTLAQLTYQELQLQQLQATVDALVIAGLEG